LNLSPTAATQRVDAGFLGLLCAGDRCGEEGDCEKRTERGHGDILHEPLPGPLPRERENY
jgi:hypothetical protein